MTSSKIILCKGSKCSYWLSKSDDHCIQTCDQNINGFKKLNEFNNRSIKSSAE